MPALSVSRRSLALIFVATALVALGFAFYTQHAWEDYYITFRSSKNLATGHGLVFNHGDKLHTFTSPLGVLLPALSYLLTFNSSDDAALWIFRVMMAGALGGAAVLLMTLARQRRFAIPAAGFLLLTLGLDAKILDFTINGMETALMLLFLAYTLWAHFRSGPHAWRHLGAAWAGLMWTRPDSFIYVGLIGIAGWLFNDPQLTGATRRELFTRYLHAGLLTTALYLPWLAWAAWYYGTPVPHTITAKGTIGDPHTLGGVLLTAVQLPWLAWAKSASLELTYLPSYYMIGGWPQPVILASRVAATLAALLWLVPRARTEVRVASFAFFGAHVYLTYFPYFPFPWYIPSTTLLGTLALAAGLAQLLAASAGSPGVFRRGLAWTGVAFAVAWVGVTGWATWTSARQIKLQQAVVENGVRRPIGEWLRAHAGAKDTVFMEPLGYIGYFSGLKTYDFPGMSSLEMVKARAQVGNDWSSLIQYLGPDWVVLRPHEVDRVNHALPFLLRENYQAVATFDRTGELAGQRVHGLAYLRHDAKFTVYRKQRLLRLDTEIGLVVGPFEPSVTHLEGVRLFMVHAPSAVIVDVPPGATSVVVQFAFDPGAYGPDQLQTDGAEFRLVFVSGGQTRVLSSRQLDPATVPGDRGVQRVEVELPARKTAATLTLQALPHRSMSKDWTCWSKPEFR